MIQTAQHGGCASKVISKTTPQVYVVLFILVRNYRTYIASIAVPIIAASFDSSDFTMGVFLPL